MGNYNQPTRNILEFTDSEEGTGYEETEHSIKNRIARKFLFNGSSIVPLECDLKSFELGGIVYRYVNKINFSVNGYGYGTDFKDIWRDEAYDDMSIYKVNHPEDQEK